MCGIIKTKILHVFQTAYSKKTYVFIRSSLINLSGIGFKGMKYFKNNLVLSKKEYII